MSPSEGEGLDEEGGLIVFLVDFEGIYAKCLVRKASTRERVEEQNTPNSGNRDGVCILLKNERCR